MSQPEESGNKILYSVAYYPRSNPIEQYFNQVKHYIKKESPISFENIKKTLAHSIKQVKEKHYYKYFIHAFNVEWLKKNRKTRRRPPKLGFLGAYRFVFAGFNFLVVKCRFEMFVGLIERYYYGTIMLL